MDSSWEAQAVLVTGVRWKDAKVAYWCALEQHHQDDPEAVAASELLSDAEMSLVEAARAWQERQAPPPRGAE